VVLALWALLLRPWFEYRLIVDLHNEAVEPYINRSWWYRRLIAVLHRGADLSLVTNDALVPAVEANGGRAAVLPDRVPTMRLPGGKKDREGPSLVVFVCSFAPDEPYVAVIDAGWRLANVHLYVTGRSDGRRLPAIPPNVRLTGFLPAAEYDELLSAAAVVVDLTAMENCLVCGAYEAVALGKPLVTSDTAALRGAFPRGVVFTQHDSDSIAAAIRTALDRNIELAAEVHVLRRELDASWRQHCTTLMAAFRLSV